MKNYWNCHLSKKLNAQETDDHQAKINHARNNNVQVIRPQPSKYASSNSKRPKINSTPEDQTCQALEEDSSSSSMAMLCNIDKDQGQQISNNPCVEEKHDGNNDFMGDLAMVDLDQFEQVIDQYDQEIDNNKWVWDDYSILDMDLWSTDSS